MAGAFKARFSAVVAAGRLTPANLLAFAAGACSSATLQALPSRGWTIAACTFAVAVLCLLRNRFAAAVFFASAGWCVAVLAADAAMAQRLEPGLEGETLVATGRVVDLPQRLPHGWRFRFCPEQVRHRGRVVDAHGCWRLGWYAPWSRERGDRARGEARDARGGDRGSNGDLDLDSAADTGDGLPPAIEAGSRWSLEVRLKRPRGLVNPGGFDSERKALEIGITAVGSVRHGKAIAARGAGIDAARGRLAERIDDSLSARPRMAALLRGLAVGDRRDFTEEDWHVFRQTGTTHLFAISGLHVGMVALVVALLGSALTHLAPALLRIAPRRVWILPPSLLAAAGYAALAGFEVPTRRTLVMIAVAGIAVLSRRSAGPWQAWCLALAAVLAVDPLAALGAGFWLSFLGVGCLLLHAAGRSERPWWKTVIAAQLAVTIGLLPVGIGFFAQASMLSALANLVAIPWITFVVVPLVLLSLPAFGLWPAAGSALAQLAAAAMAPLMALLEAAASWSWPSHAFTDVALPTILLALLGAAVADAPLPVRLRWLAAPLILPLLWSAPDRPAYGDADLHVLDVGQGTAVLVRTHRHALLFDTGAAFANGQDLGESVVLPALQALGIDRLDAVLVSHADGDHAGGAASVIAGLQVDRVLLGEPVPGVGGEPCREGGRWQWDGVGFELLHPPLRYPASGNDASCVLSVRAAGASALLPGDAGEVAELRMMNLHRARLRSDVLVLGHHGSKTSSTPDFMDAVAPTLAIATAGYRNRFGHPHPDVVRRLHWRGVEVLETARTGALHVRLGHDGVASSGLRERSRRYWHER
jgi:competence protein ComEC